MGSSRLSRIPDPKSPSCRGGPVCPPSGAQPCAPTRLSQNIIDRQGRRSLPKKAKMGDCRSRLHSHPRPWVALRTHDANPPVSPFRKGGGKRAHSRAPLHSRQHLSLRAKRSNLQSSGIATSLTLLAMTDSSASHIGVFCGGCGNRFFINNISFLFRQRRSVWGSSLSCQFCKGNSISLPRVALPSRNIYTALVHR
jgi:hypothetical protein